MEHLTGINIRTGIDLHVPINDIFKTKTESFGDERIKELYNKGNHETFKKYPDLHELFESETDDRIFFNDKKTECKIDSSLKAYIFDCYEASINPVTNRIGCKKYTEIEFVNTEILDFDHFCINLMNAQAFSGNYETPDYLYPFIGFGSFSLEDYAHVHKMAINTNCNLVYFFLNYKNVVAGIYHFTSANYLQEIQAQRKYLSDKEYRSIMSTYRKHRKLYEEDMMRREQMDDFAEDE